MSSATVCSTTIRGSWNTATPLAMKVLLDDAGLKCLDVEGIAWSPTRGLHLSDDVRLNYLVSALHG